jgi:RNA polymerase sigma factor (sigma-70 family)
MNAGTPLALGQLLHAPTAAVREAAWDELIAHHTRLLLAVARSFGGGRDEAMERYSYVLEKLREGDFHRLRSFQEDGRARFSTWLTVTARRLCLDHHRTRYGRSRPTQDTGAADSLRVVRRRLTDSIASELDADLIPDARAISAEAATVRTERDASLRAAVEALPPGDRLLLALRFEDDLSASRIAGLLGFPTPFHVYRRLNLVLGQLRATLKSRGVDGVDG